MAATKPDKIREETYDFVVEALKKIGKHPIGRSSEGLVYENHLDGEHVVIKVIKKKNPVEYKDLQGISTYVEKLVLYEKGKEEKRKEEQD
jgi:hypothetical protein